MGVDNQLQKILFVVSCATACQEFQILLHTTNLLATEPKDPALPQNARALDSNTSFDSSPPYAVNVGEIGRFRGRDVSIRPKPGHEQQRSFFLEDWGVLLSVHHQDFNSFHNPPEVETTTSCNSRRFCII